MVSGTLPPYIRVGNLVKIKEQVIVKSLISYYRTMPSSWKTFNGPIRIEKVNLHDIYPKKSVCVFFYMDGDPNSGTFNMTADNLEEYVPEDSKDENGNDAAKAASPFLDIETFVRSLDQKNFWKLAKAIRIRESLESESTEDNG